MRKEAYFVIALIGAVMGGSLSVASDQGRIELFEQRAIRQAEEWDGKEFIVTFTDEISGEQAISELHSRVDMLVERRLHTMHNVWKVRTPGGFDAEIFARMLERLSGVEYVETNVRAYALTIPNDPYYSYQWNMPQIKMDQAWDTAQGDGAVVAVVDTGIAYEDFTDPATGKVFLRAPDFSGTTFVSGYDFVNDDPHPNDDDGHGTHVAGTIAQTTNNALGVAGVAHKAALMPVKVLDANGVGTLADVADGIRWAADHDAQVINLSLGASSGSMTLKNAIAYAYSKGVTLVAAAGNDGRKRNTYPAAYDLHVIAVGAVRYDKNRVRYSNYGSFVDLVAPGGDITVDQNKDGYGDGVLQQTFASGNVTQFGYFFYQGTSMATPHVAGAAALLVSKGVTDPSQVRARLETTAQDLGSKGKDQYYGWGLINVAEALKGSAPLSSLPSPPQEEAPPSQPWWWSLFNQSHARNISFQDIIFSMQMDNQE